MSTRARVMPRKQKVAPTGSYSSKRVRLKYGWIEWTTTMQSFSFLKTLGVDISIQLLSIMP
eukprot:4870084-Prymnesium_polylepis.2